MPGLMKYVLCDNDDTDITMIAFCKQITHTSTGIHVINRSSNIDTAHL